MHFYDLPMICVLAGLALYAVLGGADFGAGFWQLTTTLLPGRSEQARQRNERIREHAHHSMGPVWEANHVWLIFVLTVTWTGYPIAFGAIASTLAVPLFLAGLGVVFRGVAYALRAGTSEPSELGLIDTIFSLSSVLTPFALGAMVGAIASERVPVGNASGHLLSSWLNPISIAIGVLAVLFCAYMAAVYLAADADRHDDHELAQRFRTRALIAGVIAGAVAIATLPVLSAQAHRVFERLVSGPGLVGLVISVLAGVATLALVSASRFALARISAALAVTGVIAGWALAQQPVLLAHLTIGQAAAPSETLIALLAAIAMGAVILFPSLALLFGLLLRGHLDPSGEDESPPRHLGPTAISPSARALHARISIAGLLGGLGFLTAAEAAWAHGLGIACLFACMIFAFLAIDPAELAKSAQDEPLALPRLRRR